MRDFFINSLEKLIGVIIIIMGLATILGGISIMFSSGGGILQGIGVLIFGALYTIMFGGMMYLFFGIYQNTKRTADAIEKSGK